MRLSKERRYEDPEKLGARVLYLQHLYRFRIFSSAVKGCLKVG